MTTYVLELVERSSSTVFSAGSVPAFREMSAEMVLGGGLTGDAPIRVVPPAAIRAGVRSSTLFQRSGKLTVFMNWWPGPLAEGLAARPYIALPSSATPRVGEYGIPQGCPIVRLGETGDGAPGRSGLRMGVASGGDDMIVTNLTDGGVMYPTTFWAGAWYAIEWVVDWATGQMSLAVTNTSFNVVNKAFTLPADALPVFLEICLPGLEFGDHLERFGEPRVDGTSVPGVVGGSAAA